MTPQELFDDLAADYLTRPDVAAGRSFRSEGLTVRRKIFAMLVDDRIVVKVPASQAAELVAGGRATAFESGGGRKMREWVSVVAAERATWAQLMADAYDHVESISRPT